jgi:hypothetical protein
VQPTRAAEVDLPQEREYSHITGSVKVDIPIHRHRIFALPLSHFIWKKLYMSHSYYANISCFTDIKHDSSLF